MNALSQATVEKHITAATEPLANYAIQKSIQKEFLLGKNSRQNMTNDSGTDVLQLPITELNLSVRARKCTTKLNVLTIGDLVTKSAKEMLECKNFGVTSLKEVREKLAERGLSLRDDT
jgi:DNA-directed RNA polymerase alpha subunit